MLTLDKSDDNETVPIKKKMYQGTYREERVSVKILYKLNFYQLKVSFFMTA